MRKYEALTIELSESFDVISTSAEVTTEKIQFPWEKPVSGASIDGGMSGVVDIDSYEI